MSPKKPRKKKKGDRGTYLLVLVVVALLLPGCLAIHTSSPVIDDHTRRIGVLEQNLREIAGWSQVIEQRIERLEEVDE